MIGRCNDCIYYHEENHLHARGWCSNDNVARLTVNAEDDCYEFSPRIREENKTMSTTKTEAKLKNLEGMNGAIENIVAQAWERGYKYGLYEANQKHQVAGVINSWRMSHD